MCFLNPPRPPQTAARCCTRAGWPTGRTTDPLGGNNPPLRHRVLVDVASCTSGRSCTPSRQRAALRFA
eukprot:6692071-Prymnesium_polylepis.1